MASNIVSDTIDATYPVAGRDNDTQGFRDNFNIIKNNFATAYTEISDLQSYTAKLNESNNFGGTVIEDAQLRSTTLQYYNGGTITQGQSINFSNGLYQTLRLNLDTGTPSLTLTLADWPDTERLAKLTVELYGNGTAKTVLWATEGTGTILYSPNWPTTYTVDSSTLPVLAEFWTYNGGETVYASYLGRFESA